MKNDRKPLDLEGSLAMSLKDRAHLRHAQQVKRKRILEELFQDDSSLFAGTAFHKNQKCSLKNSMDELLKVVRFEKDGENLILFLKFYIIGGQNLLPLNSIRFQQTLAGWVYGFEGSNESWTLAILSGELLTRWLWCRFWS